MCSTVTGFSSIMICAIPTSTSTSTSTTTSTAWLRAVKVAVCHIAWHLSSVTHSMRHPIPSGDQHPCPFEVPACAHNKAVHTIQCGRASSVHIVRQIYVLHTGIGDPKRCKYIGKTVQRKLLWFVIKCNCGFTLIEQYNTISHELVWILVKHMSYAFTKWFLHLHKRRSTYFLQTEIHLCLEEL